MEEDSGVVLFHFAVDLVIALFGRGDGGSDVVEYHLDDLDLFLEACGRGEVGADGFLKLLS